MHTRPMMPNALNVLVYDAPENRMAPEIRRFPAGMLVTSGWLSQSRTNWHRLLMHCWWILSKEPCVDDWTQHLLRQTGHSSKSSHSDDWKTRYLFCWWTEFGRDDDDAVDVPVFGREQSFSMLYVLSVSAVLSRGLSLSGSSLLFLDTGVAVDGWQMFVSRRHWLATSFCLGWTCTPEHKAQLYVALLLAAKQVHR